MTTPSDSDERERDPALELNVVTTGEQQHVLGGDEEAKNNEGEESVVSKAVGLAYISKELLFLLLLILLSLRGDKDAPGLYHLSYSAFFHSTNLQKCSSKFRVFRLFLPLNETGAKMGMCLVLWTFSFPEHWTNQFCLLNAFIRSFFVDFGFV